VAGEDIAAVADDTPTDPQRDRGTLPVGCPVRIMTLGENVPFRFGFQRNLAETVRSHSTDEAGNGQSGRIREHYPTIVEA
jgi:hypothetical protein